MINTAEKISNITHTSQRILKIDDMYCSRNIKWNWWVLTFMSRICKLCKLFMNMLCALQKTKKKCGPIIRKHYVTYLKTWNLNSTTLLYQIINKIIYQPKTHNICYLLCYQEDIWDSQIIIPIVWFLVIFSNHAPDITVLHFYADMTMLGK